MNIIFFIISRTINIDRYTIKDIPGSTGRLDVITRCILAALIEHKRFEENVQMWVFLDRYGTFIFNPDLFEYTNFPKNELLFTDYFVKFLQDYHNKKYGSFNLLSSIRESEMNLIEAIKYFKKLNYSLYILSEQGQDFFTLINSIQEKQNIVFIIGSQQDEYLYSKELSALKIPMISIGTQSYLASSVIRLLKLFIMAL
jgi:tRNA (pseudouridine54-N1)-methyltransferase